MRHARHRARSSPGRWTTRWRAGRTERLVSICQQAGADTYVSGPSARGYIDAACFRAAGIALQYFDYAGYPEYPQLFPPFDHHVSVIDLMFNTGPTRAAYLQRALTMRLSIVTHAVPVGAAPRRSSTPGSARRRPRSPTTTKSSWSTTARPTTRSTIALRLAGRRPAAPHRRPVAQLRPPQGDDDRAGARARRPGVPDRLRPRGGAGAAAAFLATMREPRADVVYGVQRERRGGIVRAHQRLAVLQGLQPALGPADSGEPRHRAAHDAALRRRARVAPRARDDDRRPVGARPASDRWPCRSPSTRRTAAPTA